MEINQGKIKTATYSELVAMDIYLKQKLHEETSNLVKIDDRINNLRLVNAK